MSGFLLLVLCPLLGLLFARRGWMPPGATPVLNAWVLKVALPALILDQIPRLQVDPALVFPIFAPWIVFVGAFALMPWLRRRCDWSRAQVGALTLTCGLGNTSFVGLPMLLAIIGPPAMGPAIIADQLGTFLALSTVGVMTAGWYAGHSSHPVEVFKRLAASTPFVALAAALVLRALGGWPAAIAEPVTGVLHRLAETLTPLALFSVGLQFRPAALRAYRSQLIAGLAWKLVLAPLIALALAWLLGLRGLPSTVGILQAAMGPMIMAGIVAQEHGLEPALANLVVSLGIACSFVTVPLWYLLLT
jgi:predicted permease